MFAKFATGLRTLGPPILHVVTSVALPCQHEALHVCRHQGREGWAPHTEASHCLSLQVTHITHVSVVQLVTCPV